MKKSRMVVGVAGTIGVLLLGLSVVVDNAATRGWLGLRRAYAQEASHGKSAHPANGAPRAHPGGGGLLHPPVQGENQVYELSPKFIKAFTTMAGGAVAPCAALMDPYPEFNGIALDPRNGIAVLSDTNLKSVLVYDINVKATPHNLTVTPARTWVRGPATFLSFAAGIAVDPVRHEFYTTENDIGDDVAAFSYTANGNYKSRVLAVPHGSYGIALSQRYKQMAVAIQHNAEIIFYRLQAHGAERPLRSIRGPHTGLADPHGVVWDDAHGEIFVSNYGNWNQGYWDADYSGGGKYFPPSIRIFKDDSKGDAAPIRVIQGPKTELNWPTGIAVDPVHNELFVANEAANQILVFARDADGDAVPLRVLGGPRTGIRYPMGVAYDASHDQLWVANFGHTAVVFGRADEGDAPPRRVIRNAPEGTPSAGFGNPMALAYDSKRDQLLVPN